MSSKQPQDDPHPLSFGRTALSHVLLTAAVLAAFLYHALDANAAVTFTFVVQEVGANVVVTGSGSINTSGLTYLEQDYDSVGGELYPSAAVVAAGAVADDWAYTGAVSGPPSFGSGSAAVAAGTGDIVGIYPDDHPQYVYVPVSYVSGSPLSDTATWDNSTFANLGLTPGIYIYSWGSGATADSLEVDIEATSTPEPASLALLCFGVAGLGSIRRYRANHPLIIAPNR